jgi:hypothetical protein
MAGFQFDVLGHVIRVICPQANEAESDKDSLTDFLEKLAILRGRNIVGEWNVTQVRRNLEPMLAVHLSDVWDIFTRNFSVNYSRQSIQNLIAEAGGEIGSTQKFINNSQTWLDFQRAKDAHDRDTSDYSRPPLAPKKTAQRRCVLIPARIVDQAVGEPDSIDSNYSDMASEATPPTTPAPAQTAPVTAPSVVAGDVATVAVDLPDDDLKVGDAVIIKSLHQAEDGDWFVGASVGDGPIVSIWLSYLVVQKE